MPPERHRALSVDPAPPLLWTSRETRHNEAGSASTARSGPVDTERRAVGCTALRPGVTMGEGWPGRQRVSFTSGSATRTSHGTCRIRRGAVRSRHHHRSLPRTRSASPAFARIDPTVIHKIRPVTWRGYPNAKIASWHRYCSTLSPLNRRRCAPTPAATSKCAAFEADSAVRPFARPSRLGRLTRLSGAGHQPAPGRRRPPAARRRRDRIAQPGVDAVRELRGVARLGTVRAIPPNARGDVQVRAAGWSAGR